MRRIAAGLAALSLALGLGLAPAHASSAEDEALARINAARAQAGCRALKRDDRLQATARSHARAMAEQDFFSHVGKDGSTFGDRIRSSGYLFSMAAENIAAGQPTGAGVVAEWMGSAGHRKAILTCRFRHTGIAMVYQRDDKPIGGNSFALKYYWVQVFARP